MRKPVKALVAGVTAVAVLMLTACDPSGGAPTEIATPTINWQPSEPTGGLYDDPYVEVALAASLGFVLANNVADYTISQLTETTTAERIEAVYRAHISDRGEDNSDPLVYPGPLPQIPISVTENDEGGADVLMCAVSGQWYVSEDHPEATTEGVEPLSITLVVIDDDGTLKLDDVRGGEGGCDADDIALGYFDPQPSLESKTVRAPLSAD
ncbi:hypothetical protein HDC94_002478 [Leifsonia sp. AK011]|uniref:hypothetical protein n=1 Tax=Leifsonia sp. AK011 TaxID=2723075 RepID=UPI0015C96724|nr:hypothetical protein [Leifsonia sp. AK011]NYF11322.1 hypothetical protein [Leifsonia sp. AK011]